MMHVVLFGVWFLCSIYMMGIALGSPTHEYVSSGPNETAALEEGLYECLPVYVCGIYPRADRMATGIGIEGVKEEYLDKVQTWLDRALTPGFMPTQVNKGGWVGITNLHWGIDYIVGKYSITRNDGALANGSTVEFQANDQTLGLTVISSYIFSVDAVKLKDGLIRDCVTNILKVPSDKVEKLDIEHHFKTIVDVNVCYGKIRCEWHERTSPQETRQWWSYIPFWYTKGKMFVAISTIDLKADRSRRARIGDGNTIFKKTAKGLDGREGSR